MAIPQVEIWVAYKDVKGFPRKEFSLLLPPGRGGKRIKPGCIPGAFNFPTVYIQWHKRQLTGVTVHLVTYTETYLTDEQVDDLVMTTLSLYKKGWLLGS